MSRHHAPHPAPARTNPLLTALGLVCLLGSLGSGCAETGGDADASPTDGGAVPPADASTGLPPVSSPDAGSSAPSFDASVSPDAPTRDASASDASASSDASVISDASPPPHDGSLLDASVFNPPPPDTKPEDWKLKPGSAADCPATPPPIPIIGGLCAGIYFMCGWETSDGRQYSCTCDWVHYLCI